MVLCYVLPKTKQIVSHVPIKVCGIGLLQYWLHGALAIYYPCTASFTSYLIKWLMVGYRSFKRQKDIMAILW